MLNMLQDTLLTKTSTISGTLIFSTVYVMIVTSHH